MPGLRSTILYWPAVSVTAVRVFSISTGLDASTVTPGRTAPVPSFTTPAIATCALAMAGTKQAAAQSSAVHRTTRRMTSPFRSASVCRGLQRLTLRGGRAAVKLKNYRPSGRSDTEALFQVAHAVSRHGELGLAGVLQADQHPAVQRGEELLHERDIDDRGAMDAREAARVEPRIEVAQR